MKKPIQIHETEIPAGKELLEDTFLAEFVLEEGSDSEGKPRLKGRFGQVDVPTANKRVYPRKIMEREFTRLKSIIEGGQCFGELDHPSDGKTKLARVSHLVTGIQLAEGGEISGVIDLIPGTTNGDQALAIARAGGKLGISSRGYGTTVPDHKGNQIVQEDYTLVTFDLVADPANAGAYPQFVVEDRQEGHMDLETMKKDHPELVEALKREIESDARTHAREALREEFEKKLADSAAEIKAEAVEAAKAELLADPEVAGSSTAMRKIAEIVRPFILREDEESVVRDLEKRLQEAEKRVADADEGRLAAVKESEKLSSLAKEAYFHLFLERNLHGDERRTQIEGMLGDVNRFEDLDDLRKRVGEITSALAEADQVQEERRREVAVLEAKNRKLEEDLERSLKAANQFAVKAYIEKRLSGHPLAAKLRGFLNESRPSTVAEVNSFVSTFDSEFKTSDEYDRIQAGLKKRSAAKPLDEEKDGDRKGSGATVMGVSMDVLRRRSGIE